MDPIYLLLAAVLVALPFVLTKLFGGKSRDTDKVMGAYAPGASPAADTRTEDVPIEVRVKALIAQGKKIEAIKLMRESNNLSLAAAKDSVEAIEQHGRATLGEMGMMSTVRLAQELSNDVQHLVAQGQKIEAIKRIREQTGLGLKEAKEIVDRLG
jgi:ribosomal protein L7/L12